MIGLIAVQGCGDPELIDGDADISTPDAGPEPDAGPQFEDGGGISMTDLSLSRVVPDHGPFTGGNTVILRGNGFDEESQATFGGRDVQPADHRLIDARRLAVVVPAGEVGPVDVTVTVDGETVELEDGYTYDAIYVEPDSGAVSGGTFVNIVGSGTSFQEGDEVVFGRSSCEDVEVVSETRITCRTPPSVAGSVDVTVIRGEDGSETTAEDAFTYFDSADPFSGGLGGGPIEGSINLTAIDSMTGAPIPDAFAIIGEDLDTEHQGLTDSLGQITFSGDDIVPPVTIHVAKHCYEKTSVVAFDARDVTVFMVPWMDPMCGEGGPPPGGGRGRNGAFIEGELIWYGPNEMGPNPWGNVPEPREGWERVAYVYTTQRALGAENPDPAAGGSIQRVTEEIVPESILGYPYSIFARPAGLAVYALAGLENTSEGRFIPYVMGVARNVLAGPGETVSGVDVVMNIPLDHYVETELTELPMEARTGPDRFRLQANIDLGGEGVIVRNVNGDELDVLRRRDASRTFRFVAQPALEGTLSDGRYRIEAGWYTGDLDSPPYTIAVEQGVTAVDSSITIGGFNGIPQATAPAYGDRLPADRILRWSADGPDPSMHIVLIIGADGNPAWRMFVPGNVREAPIPNLSTIEGIDDMPSGFLTWAVFAVTIPGFDFDEFSYEYLSERYWTRWALDVFLAQR
ncbi:MAG TPA: IPT/TIG domain-containing protein [Sandaracinaceae bacterium LLY-WYZ-13_1]|nr:IPT/TIG domain-containing protein [Sandaracinaceae bacterium LLY-WYZ-13_1]